MWLNKGMWLNNGMWKHIRKRATADLKEHHIILFVHCYIKNFEELRNFQSKVSQKGK